MLQQQEELYEIPKEIVEEVVIEEVDEQNVQLLMEPNKSLEKIVVDIEEMPKEEENKSVIEKEIIETIEMPTQKILKKKKRPKKKDELVGASEKAIVEEGIDEIVPDKPNKERAIEEGQETITLTQVDVCKAVVEMPEEKIDIKETVIEKLTTEDQHEQIIKEIVQKPIKETETTEKEEIIETPTTKIIRKKSAKIHDDNVPEEIVKEIVIEKPKKEQAKTTFSSKESIEVSQILAESLVTKLIEDKDKPKDVIVSEIKDEKNILKKVSKKETGTIPVQEKVVVEITEEMVTEKPKEEQIQSTIITKEGLEIIETISSTSIEKLPEKMKPTKETAVPIESVESQIEIKEVTVKKLPKKIEPKHANEQQIEEEIIETIISESPTKKKAKKIITTSKEIETTEIIPEIITSELGEDKMAQEEQVIPIEEEQDIKLTEVIIKKAPLVEEKAREIKKDQPDEVAEDIKIEKPKEEKAKIDVPLKESVEISEVITETIPEKLTEKIPIEKKAESFIAPVESIEITEVTVTMTGEEMTEKEKIESVQVDVEEEKEKKLTRVKTDKVIQEIKPVTIEIEQEEKIVEEITPLKLRKEKAKIEEALDTTKVAKIIPKTELKNISKEEQLELKEEIQPIEIKEVEKPKEITEEKLNESIEKSKEKKVIKKKKKKPVKKDDIEEWVEPEYERPVLEPMPEKIEWEPIKKKKEKKILSESVPQKLVPQKIERKEIQPTKLKYTEPLQETIQFGTIKLKKVTVIQKKEVRDRKSVV